MRINPEHEKEQIRDIHNILYVVMFPKIYAKVASFTVSYALSKEPVPFEKRNQRHYHPLKEGQSWSHEVFDCAWMHAHLQLTPEQQAKALYLAFDCGGEALLYSANGVPLKGFTNGSSGFDLGLANPTKRYYPLDGLIGEDGVIDLDFDCGANDLFGTRQGDGKFIFADAVEKDEEMEDICYDTEVLLDELEHLDLSDPLYPDLLAGLTEIRDLYWYNRAGAYLKAKAIANRLFALKKTDSFSVVAVGHSHLDLAWLWPIRETKRKVLRTFSNVVYLLKKYPEFTFVVSQPQQLQWLKEGSPALFEKVAQEIKAGRIEPVGGPWIEMDMNAPSGESLMRQMLYGQKFWQENFGHYVTEAWLPDCFGFSGALPQICHLTNQDSFITTKISWNRVNLFPYHDFVWQGIDGTSILAHLPPEGTYNSGAYPRSIMTMEKNTEPSDHFNEGLLVYGIGDGGGGPSVGHVERLKREEKASFMPSIRFGHATELLADLKKDEGQLETYPGELYLENHQGTYTSQSQNKQWNRYMENKLAAVEMVLAAKNNRLYETEIEAIWKEVLLYQFHDIVSGSAIKRVYQESLKRYGEMNEELERILHAVVPSSLSHYAEGAFVFNPLSYPLSAMLKMGSHYDRVDLKAHGICKEYTRFAGENVANSSSIDTPIFHIEFAADGSLSHLLDKRNGKEILRGEGNHLRVFRDHGDAWNIMDSYRNQDPLYLALIKRETRVYGPLTEITSFYSFNHSTLKETLLIDADSDLLRFHHDLDWQDTGYMLKSCFSLAEGSDEATCDIQFGSLKRSTRNDTSLERAQFEVPAQQWVDISTPSHGVALLNKAKDGYSIKEGQLELTLLRSTNYPCTDSDHGKTSYDYAFYVHAKPFDEGEVDREAAKFNVDPLYFQADPHLDELPSIDNPDIEVSCLKNAYHKEGVILRLYERAHKPGVCVLTLPEGYHHVSEVTGLEDEIKAVDPQAISFHPFEVKTLWIRP
jgi:alpha-mannosidase